MNIVLTHPVHGAKVAINQDELLLDIKNGWSVYTVKPEEEVVSKKPLRNKLREEQLKD